MKALVARSLFYPLHEWAMKRPTFGYLRELESSQWWARQEIEDLQSRKLQALLDTAWHHCPWHRARLEQAGLSNPGAINDFSIEQLKLLPTMTKAEANENREGLHWPEVPGGSQKYNTGGSSGQPLIFYFGRQRQASDAAGRMRARRWWGVQPGEREVYLWGAPVELNKTDRVKQLRDRALNQLVLNAFEMSVAAMDEYLDAIGRYRPHCIYGYASSLALIAAHAENRGVQLHLPDLKVVCTTGEPLDPQQRSLIQSCFQAPVANEFGSRDIGFTAHESPQGQMLLMSESIVLEVLDPQGNPVANGELGEAVMTGLCSNAQPFVRYRTGDMVRLGSAPCSAGRGLHVIEEVAGRQTDFIVRRDGTIMHALALIYVVRALDGVAEFRILQHDIDRLTVELVVNETWNRARQEQEQRLRSEIHRRLDERVDVEICYLDQIKAEASGKYRYVVSQVAIPTAESTTSAS